MHTLDILRLEKKFLHWGHDITSENTPLEAGLSFTVNFKKNENFIGRNSLERLKDKPLSRKLELFSLKKDFIPGKPLVLHDEPIFNNSKIIGYTTSANYSFCYKKNLCLGYIENNLSNYENLYLEVEGKKYALSLEKYPIHDPDSKALRA